MNDTPNGDNFSDPATVNWTLRRGIASTVTVLVVVLLGIIIWVASTTRGAPQVSTFPTGLLAVIPQEGDQAPRQGLVGVSLSPGWQPTLTIAGVKIPDNQLSAGTRQLGEFFFSPGEGSAIVEMRTGQVCAHLIAVPLIDIEVDNIDYRWCWASF
ncbi:MAG: hypothetical protein P8J75_05430 [Actinomycetota bacterium]|nr:hypothetical protein [Actinomycetota bacterium]